MVVKVVVVVWVRNGGSCSVRGSWLIKGVWYICPREYGGVGRVSGFLYTLGDLH